ncbi:LacI family DNA-binding transcriptional regulator [Jeotgalibacillus salarius]|uniref:LacI family transcriptional regulator n=1 Tax=Jeotgalibacillus salarius TaxID=546023 RepID=A0A4Y8LD69_9BACL|nr:LacI family DNA-binding transcriptional regulator [Jeotgalibacillus salarius]TFE00624.1 LacI family transcriptional regulator [Jeotgalibacillus salarius]
MVKMVDVARLANVSTATVSRVLRNPESVKEHTRLKVLNSIEELNYQPNVLARHFRRNKTNTILVIVPNIANTIFSQIVRGIEATASEKNFRVLLGNTNRDVEKEYDFLNLLHQRQVDGLILLSGKIDHDILSELKDKYPLVLASEYVDDVEIATVCIDNIKSSFEATEHLIKQGHKRIGHISGPMNSLLSFDRLSGYNQALKEYHIDESKDLIREGDFSYETGYQQMCELLILPEPPTAVFAANDEMAMGAINASKKKGLSVPKDLAVVGFDNIRFSSIFDPGVTTIAQPAVEMGNIAMELLLQKLDDPDFENKRITLKSELIIRESCGSNIVETSQ